MTNVRTFPRGLDLTSPAFREQLNDMVALLNQLQRAVNLVPGNLSKLTGALFEFDAWRIGGPDTHRAAVGAACQSV